MRERKRLHDVRKRVKRKRAERDTKHREVAAACRQGIWREKRIQTRRRGMSERSNTSRSFASRDYDGRKNVMGEEKTEREREKDPWVLAGRSRAIFVSHSLVCRSHFSPLYRHSFPFCAFFRRVHPSRGNQPFTRNDVPHQVRSSTTTAIRQGCGGHRHGRRVIFKTPLAGK